MTKTSLWFDLQVAPSGVMEQSGMYTIQMDYEASLYGCISWIDGEGDRLIVFNAHVSVPEARKVLGAWTEVALRGSDITKVMLHPNNPEDEYAEAIEAQAQAQAPAQKLDNMGIKPDNANAIEAELNRTAPPGVSFMVTERPISELEKDRAVGGELLPEATEPRNEPDARTKVLMKDGLLTPEELDIALGRRR